MLLRALQQLQRKIGMKQTNRIQNNILNDEIGFKQELIIK